MSGVELVLRGIMILRWDCFNGREPVSSPAPADADIPQFPEGHEKVREVVNRSADQGQAEGEGLARVVEAFLTVVSLFSPLLVGAMTAGTSEDAQIDRVDEGKDEARFLSRSLPGGGEVSKM